MVGASINTHNHLKFLCSYGGKILPRFPDGQLRYHGGQTRVLSVHRSISFAELLAKLEQLCGSSVSLRCKLPTEDLDALVSITTDEDLKNLIEEYDSVTASSLKIKAFLSLPKIKSPPPSIASSSTSSSSPNSQSPPPPPTATRNGCSGGHRIPVAVAADRCIRHIPKPSSGFPVCYNKSAGKVPYYGNVNPAGIYLIHNGNHWQ